MVEEALVEGRVTDAIEFIKTLDAKGLGPTLAAWYLYDDAGAWRLILAGPFFDALLPSHELAAYRRVAEAMSESYLSSLSPSDVKLVSTQSSVSKAIHGLITTHPDSLSHAYFSSNYVNNIFIKEMIVLRCA